MFKGRSAISVSILLGLTAAVYVPPSIFVGDQALAGSDYFELHIKRIAFAQDTLFGPNHFLPAWYPREAAAGAPAVAEADLAAAARRLRSVHPDRACCHQARPLPSRRIPTYLRDD